MRSRVKRKWKQRKGKTSVCIRSQTHNTGRCEMIVQMNGRAIANIHDHNIPCLVYTETRIRWIMKRDMKVQFLCLAKQDVCWRDQTHCLRKAERYLIILPICRIAHLWGWKKRFWTEKVAESLITGKMHHARALFRNRWHGFLKNKYSENVLKTWYKWIRIQLATNNFYYKKRVWRSS